jgi:dTDP-4-dehydrorhamnose 3,5-epimerase
MKIRPTRLPEVLLIEPQVFGDERGFFYESFHQARWQAETGLDTIFVQDNHSRSVKGVLRGLHYQCAPAAQGKLVQCVIGEVFDVAVDIRPGSATFGQWVGESLSAENHRQMWIPEGFAHGFLVLSEVAEFLYKTTDYYSPEHERSICWDDPDLGIRWPLDGPPSLSARDQVAPLFSALEPE